MPTLRIQGQTAGLIPGSRTASVLNAEALRADKLQAIAVSASRAPGAEPIGIEAGGDTMLVLHLEDGFRIFTSYRQFCEDFPGASPIGPNLGLRPAGRGIGEVILKGLEVFHVDPARDAIATLAAKVERQLVKTGPGLYRVSRAQQLALSGETASPDPSKPALIFIHGTASSSYGAFSGLAHRVEGCPIDFPAAFERLYGANIFAFEHRTLTESPVQNAVQLARALPEDAELHLVTHSRGGLVGDLLTLGQADWPDPGAVERLFGGHPDEAALGELLDLLGKRKPRITRYVRVAAPARGTTLASKRADRWFSMLLSLIGKTLDAVADPVVSNLYDALQDFLVAVASERLDPAVMPGMDAMMPDSKLIRLLNLSGAQSRSDLSVIAGSAEGKDLLARLKFFAPSVFYGGKNDLVVNYASMDGGVRRGEQRLFAAAGPRIHHLNYFQTPATRAALLGGLERKDGEDGGFQKGGRSTAEIPRSAPIHVLPPASRPAVIVIPGLFGSHLAKGGRRIWLDELQLSGGGLGRLGIDCADVTCDGVIEAYYRKLMQFLGNTHETIVFPYDWRLSLAREAERLAGLVERRLNDARGEQPLRILAHSTGGLLVRSMLTQRPGLWARIKSHDGGRFLMLGTPARGSYEVLRMLAGQSRLVRQLALIDGDGDRLKTYPGLLELLPDDLDAALRDALGLGAATRAGELAGRFPVDDRMIYVAGRGSGAPVSAQLTGESALSFMATDEGDGRVPWASGIPGGIATYYSLAAHGDLTNHEADFPALLELLEDGATAKLPKQPAAARPGERSLYAIESELEEVLPNQTELAAAALGARGPDSAGFPLAPSTPALRVAVVHGDLAFARYAVAVGHYEGDSIVGPEALLDRRLDGRLTHHNLLGVYPGRGGTAEVFLASDPASRPAGAVVVGLGKVGDLKPKDLEDNVRRAVLQYSLALQTKSEIGSGGLSMLLIGTMANVLTIEESLTAMLRAVRDANLALEAGSPPFRIDTIELLEVYEDRAIRAARSLAQLAKMPEFCDLVDLDPDVERRAGALRRSVADEEDAAWWSRLRIRQEEPQDRLTFTLITNRARSESEDVGEPQRAAALIESAIGSSAYDPELSQSLFELLVPNRLKEYAPQLSRLVLMVDRNSARYPWELMQDRLGRHQLPLAVETGLIRQLDLDDFRPAIRQSDDRTALVIANPKLKAQADANGKFDSLPGARQEGEAVACALQGLGFEVHRQIETAGAEIRKELYARSYRILHLAGHGVQQYPDPRLGVPVNGMVIGDNDFLTPAQIGQLRVVPELVFINCCHSGRTDVLAANLAVEFIGIGVRAVIAAGWAVDDAAALTFAERFYGYFLDRIVFGDAVRLARADTFERHPGANTWGAYQCYGDPGYKFSRRGLTSTAARRAEPKLFLPSQLIVELENLACALEAEPEGGGIRLRERLETLREAAPKPWWDSGEVQSSLGKLHAALGNYGEAVKCYQSARCAEGAEVTLNGIEQEANLRARAATRQRASRKTDDAGADRQFLSEIGEALKLVRQLLDLGKTAERYCILGGIYKRRAMWAHPEGGVNEPAASLRAMRDAYAQALAVPPAEPDNPGRQAFLNWALSRVVLRWFDPAEPAMSAADQARLAGQILEGRSSAAVHPAFWNTVAEADARLLDSLDGDEYSVVEQYRRVTEKAGSPLEVATVVEHLEFIRRMAELSGRHQDLAASVGSVVARILAGVVEPAADSNGTLKSR